MLKISTPILNHALEPILNNTRHNSYSINQLATKLTINMKESLIQATFKVSSLNNPRVKIPTLLRNMLKEKRQLRRTYQRTRGEGLKTTLNRLTKKISSEISRIRKEAWASLCSRKDPSSVRLVWSKIRSINGQELGSTHRPLKVNDVVYSSKQDICEVFANSLAKSFKLELLKLKPDVEAQNFMVQSPEQSPNIPVSITEQELLSSARTLKKSSAPGFDGITNVQIVNSLRSKFFIQFLLKIFNESMYRSEIPVAWKQASVTMIPKKGKDVSDPSSYRPISLLSCLAKFLEKIINNRLIKYLEQNNKIPIFQSGFRKNRSTSDHILRLTQSVKEGFNQNLLTTAVFFDLAKAFDRTWHQGLVYKLHQAKCPLYLARWIEDFLRDRTFRVRVGECVSSERIIEAGVPQGSCLSPTLFLLYVSDIVEVLEPLSDIKIALYADDICIWTTKRTKDELRIELQKGIENFCQRWRLELNVSKTNFCTFTTAGLRNNYEERYSINLFCDKSRILINPHPIFLGFQLDPKLGFGKLVDDVIKKAHTRLNVLRIPKSKKKKLTTNFFSKFIKVSSDHSSTITT